MTPKNAKPYFRYLLSMAMISVGILHFVKPDGFTAIVPAWLPYPEMLVYISGFFEVAGGVGLLVPQTRKAAAWGLVALYIAVFPANINMAVNQIAVEGVQLDPILLWGRLPFQLVFVLWAYWMTLDDSSSGSKAKDTQTA